jgi:hypothetical protein
LIVGLGTAVDVAVEAESIGVFGGSVGRRRTTHKTKTTNATTSMPTTSSLLRVSVFSESSIEVFCYKTRYWAACWSIRKYCVPVSLGMM